MTLKTRVMMLKIQVVSQELIIYTNRKVILNCNNIHSITVFTVFFNQINPVLVSFFQKNLTDPKHLNGCVYLHIHRS